MYIGSASKHACNDGSVLLHRVRAQALPNRFERDHFTGRNVAEIDVAAEVLDKPDLLLFLRRFENQTCRVDFHLDLFDQPGANLTAGSVESDGARFTPFGDDLPCPGVELVLDLLHPPIGGDHDRLVFAANFGKDGKISRQALDQPQLVRFGKVDDPVGDFHELEAPILQECDVFFELAAMVGDLEQASTATDGDATSLARSDFCIE